MTLVKRRLLPIYAALILGIGLLAVAIFVTLAGGSGPAPSGIGGPFRLVGPQNAVMTQADFEGAPTLVFFGYAHCPDVCPTTLFEMSQLFRKLGPAAKVHGVFITIDPERDTPAVLADYLSNFDSRIVGLSGDAAAIGAALRAYRVYARKAPGEGDDYSMDHSSIVYLMDAKMRFVNALNLDQPGQAEKQIEALM